MIYDVSLAIAYDYPGEVSDARHILRVLPRDGCGQRTTRERVTISPSPTQVRRERDFFGNSLDHVLLPNPHETLSVTMTARVEVARTPPRLEETPTVVETARAASACRRCDAEAPMHFLGASRAVRPSPALAALAAEAAPRDAPIGVAALALARRIRAEFTYAPGATTVATPVEEAFARRAGVCQDFAHIMIAALRAVGAPAAYASGFIRTEPPPGEPKLDGSDAMHAWVSVWLGEAAGWFGFDPTNAMLALDDHILVAIGRDYADIAPIDGVLITAGPQRTHHSVDMTPVAAEPGARVGG